MIYKSLSLKHEPSSEPLRISEPLTFKATGESAIGRRGWPGRRGNLRGRGGALHGPGVLPAAPGARARVVARWGARGLRYRPSLHQPSRFHMQTLVIYEPGFNQNYFTLLVEIVLCSKFSWTNACHLLALDMVSGARARVVARGREGFGVALLSANSYDFMCEQLQLINLVSIEFTFISLVTIVLCSKFSLN